MATINLQQLQRQSQQKSRFSQPVGHTSQPSLPVNRSSDNISSHSHAKFNIRQNLSQLQFDGPSQHSVPISRSEAQIQPVKRSRDKSSSTLFSSEKHMSISAKQRDILPVIMPLLQGAIFYKQFSMRQSLNQLAFDPLNADQSPPEACGYGIRFIQLDTSLRYINIRQNLKNTIEYQIPLKDIIKPIIP